MKEAMRDLPQLFQDRNGKARVVSVNVTAALAQHCEI